MISLNSCSEKTGPSSNFVRYVYYPVLYGTDKSYQTHEGMYAYAIDSNITKQYVNNGVMHLTSVGNVDNIMVFQYADPTLRYWGKCTDGSLLKVPFPYDSADLTHIYAYDAMPLIQLSYDGHHVAYFVNYESADTANLDPTTVEPKLIIFNCAKWLMTTISIKNFCMNQFLGMGVNVILPAGRNILINQDGSKIWFVIQALKFANNQYTSMGYRVIEWNDSTISSYSDIIDAPVTLWGIDPFSENILLQTGSTLQVLGANQTMSQTSLLLPNLSNPNQFAKESTELAIWTNDGIDIYNFAQGASTSTVMTFTSFDGQYPGYKHESNVSLSIAPDAQVITFALAKTANPTHYDLFIINRDGSGLKKIATDIPICEPVVSNRIPI